MEEEAERKNMQARSEQYRIEVHNIVPKLCYYSTKSVPTGVFLSGEDNVGCFTYILGLFLS